LIYKELSFHLKSGGAGGSSSLMIKDERILCASQLKFFFLLGFKILIPPFVNQKSLLDNCENYGKMLQSVLKESVKMTEQYDLGLGLHVAYLRMDMSSHLPTRYLDILGFLKG